MKILNRYILTEVIQYFIISLFAFVGILLTIRMIKLAGLVINRGVSFTQILGIFVAVVPTFLEIALPLAALLGTMLAFARLSGDSEIIVIRSSGVSLKQVIWPIVLFGLLTTGIGQLTSIYLRPWGFRTLHEGLFQIAKSKSTAGLEQAVFNKLGKITLYAEVIDHTTGELQKVLVDDRRSDESRKIIISKRGQITSQDQEQTLSLFLREGSIHEKVDGKYVLTRFSENNITLDSETMAGSGDEKRGRRLPELSNDELREYGLQLKAIPPIKDYDETSLLRWREQAEPLIGLEEANHLFPEELNLRIIRNKLELGRRFSLPFASLFLTMLGMALGIQPARAQRAWGATLSVAIGMLVFVIYYVLFSMAIALAESGKMDPYIALWGPNVLIGALSIYVLRNISIERWGSIGSAIEEAISSLRNFKSIFRRGEAR